MIEVRKANKKDIDKVINLYGQLYKTEQQFWNNLKDNYYSTKECKKRLLKDIKDKEKTFFVALSDDIVVGFINGYVYDKEDVLKNKTAYLDRIVVDSNYNRKGIGNILMNCFENEMKRKGVKYIKLNAFPNNEPAISLYKKNKFNEFSTIYIKTINN